MEYKPNGTDQVDDWQTMILLYNSALKEVGTKLEIQRLVLKLAEENMSVTFISSEIEEMLRTCSRLIVMRDRNIVGELTGEELTQSGIMSAIAGGDK